MKHTYSTCYLMMSITTINANFLFMVVIVVVVTVGVIIPTTFASTSHPLDDDKTVNMMEMLRDNESSGQVNRSEIFFKCTSSFFLLQFVHTIIRLNYYAHRELMRIQVK